MLDSPTFVRVFDRLAGRVATALEPWFIENQRDLAWRRTRDPYAVWVSEIMLQQTRVGTVERYFARFLAAFPTVRALAAADEETVLREWSGLGYYRRARLLHRGARYVCRELGGLVPEQASALSRIPGVGRYTAGAISAIAFDRPEPLVDGNIARVFSRVMAVRDSGDQDASAPLHWSLARAILRKGRPSVLGQGLMELGAMVCTPRNPQCLLCPIRNTCGAHARGWVHDIPQPRTRPEQPLERWWACAVGHRDRWLLVQRPPAGLLSGMWCLPLVEQTNALLPDVDVVATLIGQRRIELSTVLSTPVQHVFTHRRWQLSVAIFTLGQRPRPRRGQVWLRLEEHPPGGLPSVTRKMMARLAASGTLAAPPRTPIR